MKRHAVSAWESEMAVQTVRKNTGKLRERSSAARRAGASALVLGFAIFALLWILHIPLRDIYVPNEDDISHFVSSLLLAPGARWQDWFSRGYSLHFDLYPDWPAPAAEFARTAVTRPAFQFVLYLAHFVLGRDWASYQLINCFAVAGLGAVAFQIAQTGLGLRTGLSLVAAALVVLSPPLWVSWLFGVGYAIEPLATVVVAGAFLAVIYRRDFLCLALLILALLTKENTLWAPFAAAITVMLRPKPDETFRRRVFTAAAMVLPVAIWLGLRFVFFGGTGGTYAMAGYAQFPQFVKLIFFKLTHMHYLFITHKTTPLGQVADRGPALLMLDWITAVLFYALLFLWALRILPAVADYVRYAMHERRWPIVDTISLVTLWAAMALAFHFALPLAADRYATSVVVFAWPALVFEVEKRSKAVIWAALTLLCAVSLTRFSYLLFEGITEPVRNENFRSMDAALRAAPPGTRRIYVLSAGGLQQLNPEYVRLLFGVPAEIVRVAEIGWNCRDPSDLAVFEHSIANGTVSVTVTLPPCANFLFYTDRFNNDLANGHLYRDDAISYELPDINGPHQIGVDTWQLGFRWRRMTVHVRPSGPARFIIEHGGPSGIAWFDTP
jgi:hypothetical protein